MHISDIRGYWKGKGDRERKNIRRKYKKRSEMVGFEM